MSETTPGDLPGMMAAAGILTINGGSASHAAVVARGMGRPAICGAGTLRIDRDARTITCGDVTLDRKSTRLNSSHSQQSRMPSSA